MLARLCRMRGDWRFSYVLALIWWIYRNTWHDQSSAENLRLMFKRLHVSLALGKFMRIHRWRFTCLAFYMARDKFFEHQRILRIFPCYPLPYLLPTTYLLCPYIYEEFKSKKSANIINSVKEICRALSPFSCPPRTFKDLSKVQRLKTRNETEMHPSSFFSFFLSFPVQKL